MSRKPLNPAERSVFVGVGYCVLLVIVNIAVTKITGWEPLKDTRVLVGIVVLSGAAAGLLALRQRRKRGKGP